MKRTSLTVIGLILAVVLSCSLAGVLKPAYSFEEFGDYEYTRARLLGYMIKKNLERYHFSHKDIDDSFSRDAFDIFLKQLDPQKSFLLEKDIEELKVYSELIDDELNSARLKLPEAGERILKKRILQIREMVREILSRDFNYTIHESYETDREKLGYCSTEEELRERWRKTLKFLVLNDYLNRLEDLETEGENKPLTEYDHNSGESLELLKTAREKMLKDYDLFFSRVLEEKERDQYTRYFSSIASTFDPHTEYMPPSDKEEFDIHMRGSLEGIGAVLREEEGFVKVVRIVPGGPAYRQGSLHAEDIILKVGEGAGEPVDITYMKLRDAVRLIRGKKGTEVRLTVKKPGDDRVVIPIIRDVVQLEDTFVKSAVLSDDKDGRTFGYIKIPNFYRDFEKTAQGGAGRNSTDDVKKALKDFSSRNISGLILDLRNNGGGALTDAIRTTGLFIETGPVIQVKDSDGDIKILSDDDSGIYYAGPVTVLVNKTSASASEILAGALQDYGRAVIVGGEHTHGKGTVQSIIDLDRKIPLEKMAQYMPLGALKVTTQKFYRISGESTQFRGVLPDIILPDRLKTIETGEQYLDYALPWDKVDAAEYMKWTENTPDIAGLRDKSSKRIQGNEKFIEIKDQIDKAAERRKKTIHSLNMDEALSKREELRKEKEEKKFHGNVSVSDTDSEGKRLSEEERRKLWIKEVSEDAYVRETMAILKDMISSEADLSMN